MLPYATIGLQEFGTCLGNLPLGHDSMAVAHGLADLHTRFVQRAIFCQRPSLKPAIKAAKQACCPSALSVRPACDHTLCCAAEDQASNLLWRLQNGEVLVKHPPKVAIVLIGTNDLGAGGSCNVGEPGVTAVANGTALRSDFAE